MLRVSHTVIATDAMKFNEWAAYIREQTLPKQCECGCCKTCVKINLRKKAYRP